MSGLLRSVRRVIHPWRRFRELGDEWRLEWHTPEEDPDPGYTLHAEKIISLRSNLTPQERRCTILHETLHAEHGEVDVVHFDQHERAVRRETARLLLPSMELIADAMRWALCEDELALTLDVDMQVLRDRLRWLSDDERDALRAWLEEVA